MANEHLSKAESYSANNTLFPILGAERESNVTTPRCLFACFPSKDRSTDSGGDRLEWLRNESYKGVTCSNTEQTAHTQPARSASEVGIAAPCRSISAEKRGHVSESNSDGEEELQYHSNKRIRHKDKKKNKQKRKHKHKQSDLEQKKINDDSAKPNKIWIEDTKFAPEEAFRIHKKHDLENLRYDTLYRMDIALYKLRSHITCLGLGKRQTIKLSERKGKVKKRSGMLERYWNIQNVQAIDCLSTKRKLGKPYHVPLVTDSCDYVPLEQPQEVREQSDEGINSQEDEFLERTGQLNKMLRENPQDVESWLALVKLQEETIVGKGEVQDFSLSASGREKRNAATRLIIEKKIAVYEKALEQNPTSVELIVGHLDLCGEIMDTDDLIQKWKKVSFLHPSNTFLWRHYLLFTQSRFSVFSFSRAAKVYGKCLTTLSFIKEGTFASHRAADCDLESEMLQLFIQGCQFTKQSGHMEKAVASYQAMIELNCFCLPDLEKNTPVTGQVAFLETFWDSGQARFGEEDAAGWKSWMNNKGNSRSPSVSDGSLDIKAIFKARSGNGSAVESPEDEITLQTDQPIWKNWLSLELQRERTHLKPWKPDKEAEQTEDDCDDPERLIVFDDISPNLFKVIKTTNKLKLILSFLEMLGVPVPCVSSTTSSEVQRYLNISVEDKTQLLEARHPPASQFLGLWHSCYWCDVLCDSTEANPCWPSSEALSLIRNICLQGSRVFEGKARSFLLLLWLWFEFSFSQTGVNTSKERKQRYKDVKRLAKVLLKQPENRNDLRLWQSYAEMEWYSGNFPEACKVFNTALMMCDEMLFDEKDRREALAPLVRSYAELQLGITTPLTPKQLEQSELNKKALEILSIFAEGAPFDLLNSSPVSEMSGVRLLKSRKTYQKWHKDVIQSLECEAKSDFQQDCYIASGSMLVHQEACCALFEYLTTGVQGVLLMWDTLMSGISHTARQNEMDLELMLTFYVRLLRFHSESRGVLPLKNTRRLLHFALERFPDNPDFLSFYVQREAKSNLTGDIRRTFDRAVHKASTPAPWVFAIHYEQLRMESLVSVMECSVPSLLHSKDNSSVALTSLPVTGVIHRQRSLFERAVSSSARHSVALWRMFMNFESKNGKEKVKSVFYQALQNCPWAKVLYMDVIQYLPDELQDIVDLMTEKEIRLQAPLEEVELLLQE